MKFYIKTSKVNTFAANVVVSLKPDSCNLTPIFPDTTLNKNAKKDPFFIWSSQRRCLTPLP